MSAAHKMSACHASVQNAAGSFAAIALFSRVNGLSKIERRSFRRAIKAAAAKQPGER
jgi:hypothetical protein